MAEKKKKTDKKASKLTIQSTQNYSPIIGFKDGVVVTNDDSYHKIMEFSPINFELRSPEEQNEIVSVFSSAIRTMPRLVHLKIVNTPADIEPFLNDIQEHMDNEESEGCRKLQHDQMALINNISRSQGVARRFFMSFKYENESEGGLSLSPSFDEISGSLYREARSIQASMERCGNETISADDRDYLMGTFFSVMCKTQSRKETFSQHKAKILRKYHAEYGEDIDENDIPIADFISPSRIDFSASPNYAIIDGKYVMYCFVPGSEYPSNAVGGWMQAFFSYYDGVDIDFWIRKEDPTKITQKLSRSIKLQNIDMRHKEDITTDYDDLEKAVQSGYYLKQQVANGDDFCYMATILTITADSRENLEIKFKAIRDGLIRSDIHIMRCWCQQEAAYNATLPLGNYDKDIFEKSKRNIMSSDLGSCYPFTAYELNDQGGIFFGINTRYGTPVFLNIFDRHKYHNANMLIMGPSGSGKTYSLMAMLLRMRQQGLPIFIIAPFKGNEFKRACEAIDGEFIRIAPGSQQNINIMEIRKHDSDSVIIDGEEMGTSGSVLTDKIQQIERFFTLLVTDLREQEKQILDDALMETYRKYGINTKNKSLYDPANPEQYRKMPVLGDLFKELQKVGEKASRMCEALSRYVTGSARSFNQQTNVNLDNKYVVLDVSDMTAEMLPVGMFIALDYALDAAKADKSKNKVIAIDEMWRLMKASKLTAEFTVECFKIIRGYGGSVIGATQDLSDVINDENGAAIINNAQTKFFFPMERKEVDTLSTVIDMTSEEKKQLRASTTGQGERKMLMVAGSNRVFISVKTSGIEHDLITTSADDLSRIKQEKLRFQEANRRNSAALNW